MIERDAFLAALSANEDDTTTRLVYADWLDEQGEHEEADRQRKWPAAKEWLVRFCEKNNTVNEDDPEEWSISYETLIELTLDSVARSDGTEDVNGNLVSVHCGNNEAMCDALRDNSAEFCRNWSIVTGVPVPPGGAEWNGFRCGC